MKFNDFPILNNEEYKILEKNYKNILIDRKEIIATIHTKLLHCKSSMFLFSGNVQLVNCLKESIKDVDIILENLNLNANLNSSYKNLTIFELLQNINYCSSLLIKWQKNETQIYYKQIIISCIQILNKVLDNILLTISSLNIKIFKYM